MNQPWWFAYARCRTSGIGRRTFTEARGGAVQLAKTICSTCPAEDVCLWYAVSLEDDVNRYGVYGGTSPSERQVWVRQHHVTKELAAAWYEVTQRELVVYVTRPMT